MKTITIITGSARPHSVNHAVVELVKEKLQKYQDTAVAIADLEQLALPFYNAPMPPSADDFATDDVQVREWSKCIEAADGVVFVSPEYNHGLSGIQKNAIDWLYKEWRNKPAAFVGYGWYQAAHSYAQFKELNSVIKLDLAETMTGLQFTKDIDPSGAVLDGASVDAKVDATLAELVEKINSL